MKKTIVSFVLIFMVITVIFSENLYCVKRFDGTYCFIDYLGNEKIVGEYLSARNFSEGFAYVETINSYLFINENGDTVLTLLKRGDVEYGDILSLGDFHDGYAKIEFRNYRENIDGYAFINNKGELKYTQLAKNESGYKPANLVRDFSEGLAAIKIVDKWGFLDKLGNWVINPVYSDVKDFHNGYAWIKYPNTDKWGLINSSGELIIKPQYHTVFDFSEGLALVLEDGGFRKFIDPNNNVVIEFNESYSKNFKVKDSDYMLNFDELNSFYNGLAAVIYGDHYDAHLYYINKDGNIVINYRSVKGKGDAAEYVSGFTRFSENRAFLYGRWSGCALIDTENNIIMPFQKDIYPTTDFINGIARCVKGKSIVYINLEGKIIYTE